MELSVYTTHTLDLGIFSPQEALKFFTDRGVCGGVFLEHELSIRPFDVYCDLLESAGMRLDGFVSLCSISALDEPTRASALELCKKQADLAMKRGVSRFMIAPKSIPAKSRDEVLAMRSHFAESLSEIIEHVNGSGITVCIENYSLTTRPDSLIADLRWLFDNVQKLGFVLDTGNFYCVQEDVLTAYETLRDRLVQVHCKDWCHDPNGPFERPGLPRFNGCVLGDGLIPLSELLNRIARNEPHMNIMYEDNSSCLTPDMIDRSLTFLKKGWSFDA